MASHYASRLLLRRLGALLYDALILGGILMLTSLVLVAARGGQAVPAGALWFQAFIGVQIVSYFVGFWALGGQTPGMRTWRLRLVGIDYQPVPAARAAWRLLVAVAVNAPAGAGFTRMLISRDGRSLQDLICGTDVLNVDNTPG